MTVRQILCAVDFSAESPKVLRTALSLARDERATLTVVHVLDPLLVQAAQIEYAPGHQERAAAEDLRRLIAEHAADAGIDTSAVRQRIRVGVPAAEILAEAAEHHADLIVIGTHGFSGMRRLVFGSTAARVLEQTRTPVLVLPSEARLRGVAVSPDA